MRRPVFEAHFLAHIPVYAFVRDCWGQAWRRRLRRRDLPACGV